ncbi:hypothetical protein VKT23_002319 [Stygiomarasmius scandens]|uniref:Uncharacterized protein n=1 Tax=Marasmiellus scandens TaxID=2682957 RepID=A0ABR1K219_9AGAR
MLEDNRDNASDASPHALSMSTIFSSPCFGDLSPSVTVEPQMNPFVYTTDSVSSSSDSAAISHDLSTPDTNGLVPGSHETHSASSPDQLLSAARVSSPSPEARDAGDSSFNPSLDTRDIQAQKHRAMDFFSDIPHTLESSPFSDYHTLLKTDDFPDTNNLRDSDYNSADSQLSNNDIHHLPDLSSQTSPLRAENCPLHGDFDATVASSAVESLIFASSFSPQTNEDTTMHTEFTGLDMELYPSNNYQSHPPTGLEPPFAPRISSRLLIPTIEQDSDAVDHVVPPEDESCGLVIATISENNSVYTHELNLPSSSPPEESFLSSSSPLCSSSPSQSSVHIHSQEYIHQFNFDAEKTKECVEPRPEFQVDLQDLPPSSSPTEDLITTLSSPVSAPMMLFHSSPVKIPISSYSTPKSNRPLPSSSSNSSSADDSNIHVESGDIRSHEHMQPSSPLSSPFPRKSFSSPPCKKRKRNTENRSPTPSNKTSELSFPVPKRLTFASQKLQRQKLSAPFRSPLLKKQKLEVSETLEGPKPSLDIPIAQKDAAVVLTQPHVPPAEPLESSVDRNMKHRTARAAAQFKSPLTVAATSQVTPAVRLTPAIQSLERKVQQLKRALKVKNDGEEDTLKGLVERWTEAGREVAWELWRLVKDNTDTDAMDSTLGKRRLQDSWGWDEGDRKRNKSEDIGNEVPDEENNQDSQAQDVHVDEERRELTLGTMLRQLGIDPDTLGWNDEEDTFRC